MKNILKELIKNGLKKVLDWYINPFIGQQNNVNLEVQNEQKLIKESLQETKNELIQLQDSFSEKLNTLEFGRLALCDLTEKLYHTSELHDFALKELKTFHDLYTVNKYVISPSANEIVSKIHEDKNDNFNDIGKAFRMNIIQKQSVREYIVLLCEDFFDDRNMEAIRKETYFIFNQIKERSNFLPLLISLKMNSDIFYEDNDIFYVGDQRLAKFLGSLKVKLVIWNCPVVNYAHCASDAVLKYPLLMRLTNQNPLQMDDEDISGYALETLLHLNDYGFFHVRSMSEYAKNKLETVGFKNVSVIPPQLDALSYKRKNKTGKQRIIGFASSPMLQKQTERRGVNLLAKVVAYCKDYHFKILWRNKSTNVPDELLNCENVELVYGLVDMNTFYEEIDSLIIPYASTNDNHGCSLSAIEAMLFGIPVIATNLSGVSELVIKLKAGLVCAPEVKALCDAIKELYDNYMLYKNLSEHRYLCQLLTDNRLMFDIQALATEYRPDNIVTLDEWKRELQDNEKYLVQGRENIKNYYSQFSVAEHYTETRFSTSSDKCLDLFERESIDYLIEHKRKNESLKILDVACGDGRILQEDIKYGECVAMDTSSPMLNLVRERFGETKNLKTIQGDYFTDLIADKFDIISTFRYIRHFSYNERKALYDKFRTNLKEDGVLIFDVPNIKYELEQRKRNGWKNYNIYDVFWTKESIVKELNENGFRLHNMIEVGTRLMQDSDEPMTWTIAAIKKF